MVPTSLSLLARVRAASPDAAAWHHFDAVYRPLVLNWLRRDPTLGTEADDLAQEVFAVVVRELSAFERRRDGSFRAWLKAITLHQLQAYWAAKPRRPAPLGSDASILLQLADPSSKVSRQWDAEYDRHVFERLLDMVEPEFSAAHWKAFRRVVFDRVKPTDAAAEVGLTPNAVRVAKSKILRRLREEGDGLLD